ncbi:MAG: hypothetical protein FJ388_12060, partial [Verrucomicrobia bacterium]|nr:hypothetical protein [Verrucomicrobiota bacterium]
MNRMILAACLLAGAAFAADETSVPAIALERGAASNGGDFVVGYRFTLDAAMTLTGLGVTDQNSDGKLNGTAPAKVALWDASGNQLASAEVPLNAMAENGAFYARIQPQKLDAGGYVIGALTQRGGERFFYDSPIKTVPGVRWEEGRFEFGSQLVFPRRIRPQSAGYFGPVFKVVSSAATAAAAVPALRVEQPVEHVVFQRDERGMAEVPIRCELAAGQDGMVEVRAVERRMEKAVCDWATAARRLKLP